MANVPSIPVVSQLTSRLALAIYLDPGANPDAQPTIAYANGRSKPMQAVLSYFHSHPSAAFAAALLLSLLLLLLILSFALQLVMANRNQDGERDRDLKAHPFFVRPIFRAGSAIAWIWHSPQALPQLLIEADTNSFSLSKLQFLLWTAASIYGYTYLWVSHTFVQGLAGLPDYATTFPWQVLLSAATTVVAQGAKGVVGTKGGGPLKPQLSDFISAGGSVAPGRVQFFSWTLVAVTAYLASVMATDPLTIQVLPNVPQGLLSISGISAGAYLAARVVSSPGPLLSVAKFLNSPAAVTVALGSTTDPNMPPAIVGLLQIVGGYLSPNATLLLFKATGDGDADDPSNASRTPVHGFDYSSKFKIDPKDVQPNNSTLYQRLLVYVLNAGDPLADGEHYVLRLQNPDGKYAEVQIQLPTA